MTIFHFCSDLHQEFTRDREASRHPDTRYSLSENLPSGIDFVIIAGDLDVDLEASLRRIADELPNVPVIYVPGNHDFYSDSRNPLTMVEMKARGRALADELGITLLMDNTVIVGDVRVIGSTLWSDFDSIGTGFLKSKTSEAEGRHGMNDYKRIKRESTATPGKRKRLRPQDTIFEHRASRAYIESELHQYHEGPTVVVTHHAPHPQSLDPRHTSLNYCYASNLSSLFEEDCSPDLWLHGHIHTAVDYTIGKTQIKSNPRGYLFDGSDLGNGFEPDLIIEIDGYDPKPGW